MSDSTTLSQINSELLPQIQALVDSSRQRVAVTVNSELTMPNWNIGSLLKHHLRIDNRAAYGQKLVIRLAEDLTEK